MYGGHRVRRLYRGTCWTSGCGRRMRVGNFCNRCHLRHYFKFHPDKRFSKITGRLRRENLASDVAQIAEINQKKALKVIRAIFQTIERAILAGETVEIAGFGTFGSHSYDQCIYGHKYYFIPAKELLEMVNQGYLGP